MLIAFLADIHSNDRALGLVEADLRRMLADLGRQRYDQIWLLGDLIGYMPWAVETLTRLVSWQGDLAERVACLAGNHEGYLLGDYSDATDEAVGPAIAVARRQLDARPDLDMWLQETLQAQAPALSFGGHRLAYRALWTVGATRLALCHGMFRADSFMNYHGPSPLDSERIAALRRQEVRADFDALASLDAASGDLTILLCGHVHLPFDWWQGPEMAQPIAGPFPEPNGAPLTLAPGEHLLCGGSVGAPRDRQRGALTLTGRYLILDLSRGAQVYAREVRYPRSALVGPLQEALHGVGYDATQSGALLRHLLLA